MSARRDVLVALTVLMAGFLVVSNSVRFYTVEPVEEEPDSGLNSALDIHCIWKLYRGEILIKEYHHPATKTTIGLDWIKDQLGDSPSTDPAKWIANSNSSDSPSSAWSSLPDEITTDGLERKAGTFATNPGNGKWNITASFSVTGNNSTQLAGLYYAASGNYLLAADEITLTNVESGDTLEITFNCTVT